MQKIDDTETIEFADSVIDTFCPPVAEAVGNYGGLMVGLVRTRKIIPGPMAKREYARANRLEEENIRLRIEKGATTINVTPGATIVVKRPPQTDKGKTHRDRAKGVTDEWIASKFNSHALELVREKKDDGRLVHEKKRGGGGGNYLVGTCSKRTVQGWIKKYPDAYHVEPKSGFHAGMLTDKKQIEDAERRWEKYWRDYAKAFYDWRQVNKYAPREHFRYDPDKTIHQDNILVEADIPSDIV